MQSTVFDQKIEELKRELAKAEAERDKAVAAEQRIKDAIAKVEEILSHSGVSKGELFECLIDDLINWVGQQQRHPSPEGEQLLRKFGSAPKANAVKAAKISTGPKLAVGKYLNPHTQETIEKIKRAPKQLDQWVAEYGFDTVASWRQA